MPVYGFLAAHDQIGARIAFDGTNYLVVWRDERWKVSREGDICGCRVSLDGTVLDPGGIPICSDVNDQGSPAVAFNGTDYLVVWEDNRSGGLYDIYGARVAVDGSILDPSGIPVCTVGRDQLDPAITSEGGNCLVAWADQRSMGFDIYGARVAADGSVLDPGGDAISTAGQEQIHAAVAFDGANYLVVWDDYRSGTGVDIYGSRVSPEGNVIDPSGISIAASYVAERHPAVAFDGLNYLVVWQRHLDIYGTRLTVDGAVIDTSLISISTAVSGQYDPEVCFMDSVYLVAWRDRRNGTFTDVYAARVSTNGNVLDSLGIQISVGIDDPYYAPVVSVASNGSDFLVVWDDSSSGIYYDIYGSRVSAEGIVLDSSSILVSTCANRQMSSTAAYDGTGYLVAWGDARNPSTAGDIYGTRVGADGTVLDTLGIPICTDSSYQHSLKVVFGSDTYLVVWCDKRSGSSYDIYGSRVAIDGTVLDPDGIPICTNPSEQSYLDAAFGGDTYLVVWCDNRSGSSYDIYGSRVATDGTVLDPEGIPICTADGNQYLPKVAFAESVYMVTWQDGRSGPYHIYAARVTPGGSVLDPSGFAVCTDAYTQRCPALSFGKEDFIVTWHRRLDDISYCISGVRVSPDGTVVDTTYSVIASVGSEVFEVAVGFDGVSYLVGWSESCEGGRDIYGARVTYSGAVVYSGAPIAAGDGIEYRTHITPGAFGQLLVTYNSWLMAPYGSYRICGNIVTGDTEAPSVSLLQPNGGEIWYFGGVYDILWTANDNVSVSSIDILLSRDGGVTYPDTIATDEVNDGTYSWLVDADSTEAARVRVIARDAVGMSGRDSSDANFKIPDATSSIDPIVELPSRLAILSCSPNPFTYATRIRFALPGPGTVRLTAYDVEGRFIQTLVEGRYPAGFHSTEWLIQSDTRRLPAGIYFLRLQIGANDVSQKVVICR